MKNFLSIKFIALIIGFSLTHLFSENRYIEASISQSEIMNEGFSPETLVKTKTSYVPISSLNIHDEIVSFNLETNQESIGVVTNITSLDVSYLVTITLHDDSYLVFALNNRLYSHEKNCWLFAAQDVESILSDNNLGVKSITYEKCKTPQELYFITVEPNHNFFITKHDILVHNAAPPDAIFTAGPAIIAGPVVAISLFAANLIFEHIIPKITNWFKGKKCSCKQTEQKNEYIDPSLQEKTSAQTLEEQLRATAQHDGCGKRRYTVIERTPLSNQRTAPAPALPPPTGTPIPEPKMEKKEGCCKPQKSDPINCHLPIEQVTEKDQVPLHTPIPEPKQIFLMKENEENLINEILKDASPDNKKNNPKKGKSRIFHKKGASDKAFKDFRKLKPSDIKTIDSGYTGKLSDSCQVNVRTNSSGKIPTLEIIFNKFNRIKIRYH